MDINKQLKEQLHEQRRKLRAQRRALSDEQHAQWSQQAAAHLASHRIFRAARNIACYLPNDGEVDTLPIMAQAWAQGKKIFLPVLSEIKRNHLHFLPYELGDPLIKNRFGIPEPMLKPHCMVSPRQLDLVITPLVGFDAGGSRLGMGGGFYDRSFAFLRFRRFWRKPHLLGLAFDFQEVVGVAGSLPRQPWDVPLKGMVTESGLRLFSDLIS